MSPPVEQLLHDANPARQSDVDELSLGEAPTALRDAIVLSALEPAADTALRARQRRRWPIPVGASVALGVAALFAVSGIDRIDGVAPSPGQAWAASAVKLAESVPRILPADPAWKVTRADQSDDDNGEVRVVNGNRSVQLTWYARSQYDDYSKDRQQGTTRLKDARAAGEPAAIFRYTGSDDYFAMWKTGKHFIEARVQQDIPPKWQDRLMSGDAASAPTFSTHFDEPTFRAFVENLREMSVDAWLLRMPASVVKPAENATAVRDMLSDIPTPKGFDPAALIDDTAPRDPYQLGAKVTGAVSCAWIAQWFAARTAGNTAARDEAVHALSTARHWKVLRSMDKNGDFPEVIWQFADTMRRGEVDFALGNYREGLGCQQRVR